MFTGKRKEEEPWYELVPDGPILSHKELLEQSSSIPEYAIRNQNPKILEMIIKESERVC